MSNMKCPFCQQGLQPVSIFDNRDARCVWYCPNCATNERFWVMANERVWQALTDSMEEHDLCHDALVERTKELDRTRKALEIAVDALDAGKTLADIAGFKMLVAGLEKALAEITTLEQKD